jgi:hypothetical protein
MLEREFAPKLNDALVLFGPTRPTMIQAPISYFNEFLYSASGGIDEYDTKVRSGLVVIDVLL